MQHDELWMRWRRGEFQSEIGRALGKFPASIFGILCRHGGIQPAPRSRAAVLTIREREEISRGLVRGLSLRSIAKQLNQSPSTLSREVSRNGGRTRYRATGAEQQVSGWLKRTYTDDLAMQVSHEIIYRSLYIQSRGVLDKRLQKHLRTKRVFRQSRHGNLGRLRSSIKNAISIAERPAAIEDRSTLGHWDGDLIAGSSNTE